MSELSVMIHVRVTEKGVLAKVMCNIQRTNIIRKVELYYSRGKWLEIKYLASLIQYQMDRSSFDMFT